MYTRVCSLVTFHDKAATCRNQFFLGYSGIFWHDFVIGHDYTTLANSKQLMMVMHQDSYNSCIQRPTKWWCPCWMDIRLNVCWITFLETWHTWWWHIQFNTSAICKVENMRDSDILIALKYLEFTSTESCLSILVFWVEPPPSRLKFKLGFSCAAWPYWLVCAKLLRDIKKTNW